MAAGRALPWPDTPDPHPRIAARDPRRGLRHEPAHRRGVDRDGARNPARGGAAGGRRGHADVDREPPELRLRRHPGRARAHLVPQRPRSRWSRTWRPGADDRRRPHRRADAAARRRPRRHTRRRARATPGYEVSDGRITQVASGRPDLDAPVVDLQGAWLLPGYIDLHVHGGGGHNVSDSLQEMEQAVAFHRGHGTTATLVSLMTAPEHDAERPARLGRRAGPPRPDAARPCARLAPRGPVPVAPPPRRPERGAHARTRPGAARAPAGGRRRHAADGHDRARAARRAAV